VEAASERAVTGPTLHRLIGSFAGASEARLRLIEAEFRRAA
jgi:hypothetical protein